MPRPKKGSPEAKAWAAKMKAKREAKTNPAAEEVKQNLNPGLGEEPKETISVADYNNLVKQIEELKAGLFSKPENQAQAAQPQIQQPSGATVSGLGMFGTVEKYLVDPANYPNPVDRLLDEPRLAQFAMRVNFDISYTVSTDQYETIDRVRMKEPRFTLELHRVVFDEDGNPTKGRYVLSRLILHEDPQAAITMARERDLDIDQSNEKLFLDEMRYLRMRDWLMDVFFPPKSTARAEMREMVVDGRQVQYFEANSEDSSTMPFEGLKTKV